MKLIEFGKHCNLTNKKADEIVSTTINAFSHFLKYAKKYDVNPELTHTIQNNLRINI